MNVLSFYPESSNQQTVEQSALSIFQKNSDNKKEITQGMSVNKVADIVSDQLMEIVKKDFAEKKVEFNIK